MSELIELTRPFPPNYIKKIGKEDYVPHGIVEQRLIHIFGRPPKVEVLRELYDEAKLTGVIMRMTVPGFDPVEEAGESDNPQSKTNGARAKDACSDAYKRCAMRLGLGLHLWCAEDYFLFDALTKSSEQGRHGVQGEPGTDNSSSSQGAAQPSHETPARSEGSGEVRQTEGSVSSSPEPVKLSAAGVAKRTQFKQLCKKLKVDPKTYAQGFLHKDLKDCTEADFDSLIADASKDGAA